MSRNDTSAEKRIVQQLDFDRKTAKRAALEAFEFTVIGRGEVEVKNLAWGHLADDHTYTVTVEKYGDDPLPVACDCPGFEHHYGPNGEADKHMVALATVGGPTVLEAALSYPESGAVTSPIHSPGSRDARLRTDGGAAVVVAESDDDSCPNGDDRCEGPDGDDLPCWPCYQDRVEGA